MWAGADDIGVLLTEEQKASMDELRRSVPFSFHPIFLGGQTSSTLF